MSLRTYIIPFSLLFVPALGGCRVNASVQEARGPEVERPGMARQVLRAEREQVESAQE